MHGVLPPAHMSLNGVEQRGHEVWGHPEVESIEVDSVIDKEEAVKI